MQEGSPQVPNTVAGVSTHPAVSRSELEARWEALERRVGEGAGRDLARGLRADTGARIAELERQAREAREELAAVRAQTAMAVKAHADSERRYRYMGETIPFGVWWCNPQGEAEYVSPSFCELLNMTLEEQKKFGWTQRLVPEDVKPMMDHWLYCCATGTPWEHEHRVIDRHGKVHTVLSRGLPIRDGEGKITAWVGVNLDITTRKETELQLIKAKAATEEALRFKDQFMANISHELRTPLTLIMGPVRKLIGDDNLREEQRHSLGVVERNAGTLLKTVNDLLDLSKIDAGRMTVGYARVDLAWIARFVASHFESIADVRRIRMILDVPQELPAEVDPHMVQRILLNLLSNAFKFTPPDGRVHFTLRQRGAQAVFTIQDTGPGIPAEMREVIFEPFRQVDGSPARRHGGTGLGLAIVRDLVRLHAGAVAAEEAEGGGALFRVEIPVAAPEGVIVAPSADSQLDDASAQAALADLRQTAVPAQPVPPAPGDLPLVLVVEDNPEMRAFVVGVFSARHRVVEAANGREGREAALRWRPDLIVTDVMMPEMSGADMVRAIRQHQELDRVPILLLTAKADDALRVRLLTSGAQDWLVKPFQEAELLARAGGLIERKRLTEALLLESETRYQTLFNSIDEGFCIVEMRIEPDQPLDYRFIEVNRAFEKQSPLKDVTGKWMRELRPDIDDHWFEIYRDVALTGTPLRLERAGKALDGRWFSLYAFRVGDPGQRRVAILFNDITPRKRAEEALQQAKREAEVRAREAEMRQQTLSAMMEHIPLGIIIADGPQATMRAVSRFARDIMGWVHGRVEGEPDRRTDRGWRILSPNGTPVADQDRALTRAARDGETVMNEEYILERHDGTRIPILCTAGPIRDSSGVITGAVTAWVDISERKRVEEVLQRTLRELERSNADLEQYAFAASHDLKSPLRAIESLAQWLEEDLADRLDDQQRTYFQLLQHRADRMARLLDDLLDYSRAGRVDAVERVDVADMLRTIVDHAPHPPGFRFELREPLPILATPAAPLRQVFENLINNAIKHHHRAEGVVTISAREEGGFVEFSISDDGPGIPPSEFDRVWGMFQTLRPRDEREGSGMGLAIVKRIVEGLGGTAELARAASGGLMVRFRWPVQVLGPEVGSSIRPDRAGPPSAPRAATS